MQVEDFRFQCLKSLVDRDPMDKVCAMDGNRSIYRLKTSDFSALSSFLMMEDPADRACEGLSQD